MPRIEYFVAGKPAPKGSMAMGQTRDGRAFLRASNSNAQNIWGRTVRVETRAALRKCGEDVKALLGLPVAVVLRFQFMRPKNHFGSGRFAAVLKANAPALHTGKPDLDKLVRCVLDELTGLCFTDDSQVVRLLNTEKQYAPAGESAGVWIIVKWLGEPRNQAEKEKAATKELFA